MAQLPQIMGGTGHKVEQTSHSQPPHAQ